MDYYNAIQDAVNGGASIEEIAADRKLQVVETPAILPSGRAPASPPMCRRPNSHRSSRRRFRPPAR